MIDELRDWSWIALVGFLLLYPSFSDAEPLHLSPTGCKFYAKDSNHMALKRDAKVSEADTMEYYDGFSYDPIVKPHLMELIHYVYSSPATAEEIENSLYEQCIRDEGWIGKKL